jgi:hypothetical protein
MAINPNAVFNELKIWLEENLTDEKSIKACCQQLNIVPETKGIYFWFMHTDGYNALSNYFDVQNINPYTKVIDKIIYDLVYIGTAGVRNNSSGINNGHLRERLKWHLCDNKNVSAICTGKNPTMSTYRRTIGGLISDDLIANNIQDKIDELFSNYFVVYYLEYPGTFLDVKDEVSKDEDILIDVIRPIFNLKKNINAENQNHITYKIQQRRQLVESESKKRWCNEKTKTKTKVMITKPNKPKTINSNIETEEKCIRFTVNINQSINDVVNEIPNLPIPCRFICRNTSNPNQFLYPAARNHGWRITGNIGIQNIYTYFGNNDNIYANNHGYNSNIRWRFIQEEMQILGINEITVTVCP